MRGSLIALALTAMVTMALPGIAVAVTVVSNPVAQADDPRAIASRFLDQLDAGDYAAAEATLTEQMASAVPAGKLKLVWEQLPAHSGDVAGLIMLAAPARSLLDLLPEQNRYLLNADGSIGQAEQDFLDGLDASIARVRSGEPMQAAETPLGLPVDYWRGFDRIDPVADALASNLPMLLLQGGRDFQVIETDWNLWSSALANRQNATLKYYPALNHLGIPGAGPGSMAEYQIPGHVDPTLINDIAAWIQR